jgi:hypothetical protein
MGKFSQIMSGYRILRRRSWSVSRYLSGKAEESAENLFSLADNANDILTGYPLHIRRTGPHWSVFFLWSNMMRALRDRQLSCFRFRHVSASLCTRSEEKIPTAITIELTLWEKRDILIYFQNQNLMRVWHVSDLSSWYLQGACVHYYLSIWLLPA